jgi:hypothetical protein
LQSHLFSFLGGATLLAFRGCVAIRELALERGDTAGLRFCVAGRLGRRGGE